MTYLHCRDLKIIQIKGYYNVWIYNIGINLHETKDWPSKVTPVTRNKTLVIIYSCGGNEGDGAFPKDYLGSYLQEVFALIGYDDVKTFRIEGSMKKNENILETINSRAASIADEINNKYLWNKRIVGSINIRVLKKFKILIKS